MGFELDVGFIGHLYTQLGTTSSYSTITNLRNSQITTTPTVSSSLLSSPAIPWQRLLTVEILQFHTLRSSLKVAPFQLPLFLTDSLQN
jgi:hypothetical protein